MKRQSMKMTPSAKTKMTISTRSVVAGLALGVILVSVSVFMYLNLGNSYDAKAASTTWTAVTNPGNNNKWESSLTWWNGSANGTPVSGDILVIPAGRTVNFDHNLSYTNLTVRVYGTLNFSNGDKLSLNAASVIEIFTNGTITGGNNGSMISIGTTDYRGAFDIDGPIKLGSGGTASLPITLVSFTGKATAEGVKFEWITAAEKNNEFFTLERSTDASNFEAIEKIKGAGNSKTLLTYRTTDESPLNGVSYYRLRQTDYNGETTVSKVVSVQVEKAASAASSAFRMYPNPIAASDNLNLELPAENATITILGKGGEVVLTQQATSVSEQVPLNNLTPGMYMVRVQTGSDATVQRLIVR